MAKLDISNKVCRIVIYAADNNSLKDSVQLQRKLYALKKRFNLAISLVLNSTFELEAINLSRLVEDYGIGDIHISGNLIYTFSDAVSVAMRAKTEFIYLCSIDYLLKNFNDVLRFIFDSESLNKTNCEVLNTGNIYYIAVSKLRNLGFDYIGYSSNYFFNALTESATEINISVSVDSALVKTRGSISRQMFISESAVRRMYGIEKLLVAPILFDGISLDEYQEICIVEPNKISLYNTETKKLTTAISDLACDIDLYPAPSIRVDSDAVDNKLIIPRVVLSIQAGSAIQASKKLHAARVGYIMSNYNKDKYIAASIFSVLSQFHKNITIFFGDDVSSDSSKLVIESFLKCVDLSSVNIIWNFGEVNRGTYWIRNDIIYRSKNNIDYFFINDSDDYSTSRRTEFQLQKLLVDPEVEVVMVDIVRTDGNYKLLSMNNEIERYGTATTAFRSSLIDKIGYFQVFRKNTDTEFIERVKTFIGETAVFREHYPGLYQTFDGTNLTSDIYTISDGNSSIEVSTGMRGVHDLMWRKHHSRLKLANLPSHFSFPESTIPGEFKRLDRSFFVFGYEAFDSVGVYIHNRLDIPDEIYDQMKNYGYLLIYPTDRGEFIFEKKEHEIFCTDLNFTGALSAYMSTFNFYGYIISSGFLSKINNFKKSPGSLLRTNLRNLVHKSKSAGDRFVYDQHEAHLPKSILSSLISTEVNFFGSNSAISDNS